MILVILVVWLILRNRQAQKPVVVDECEQYAQMVRRIETENRRLEAEKKRQEAERKRQEAEKKRQLAARKAVLDRQVKAQQADRLESLNMEIDGILYALDKEEKALLQEYKSAAYKRQIQIKSRLTQIASKRAATVERLARNDNKIDQLRAEAAG